MKKFKQKHFEKAMDFEVFLDYSSNGEITKLLTYNPFYHEFSVTNRGFGRVYSDANLAIQAYNENDALREQLRKIAFYANDRRWDNEKDDWNLGFQRAMEIVRVYAS